MSISVADVLKLPVFQSSQLIAGASGLDRAIEGISLFESPGSEEFVTPNTLILTNAQALVTSPSIEDNLIDLLVKKKISAIGFKLNRNISSVPPSIIKRADELGLPIIIVPYNSTGAQLINAVTYEVFRSEAHDYNYTYETDFLRDLLIGNEDIHILKNRCATLGWKPKKTMGVIIIKVTDTLPETDFNKTCLQAGFPYCFLFGDKHIALTDLDEAPSPDTWLVEKVSNLYKTCTVLYPSISFFFGIGRCYRTLLLLPRAFYEAQAALCMGLIQTDSKAITRFGNMGIMTVLLDSANRKYLDYLLDQTVGLLERKDEQNQTEYMKTLRTYYQEGMSLGKAANKLYVHYNTVRNRIHNAERLLAESSLDVDISMNLSLLIEIADWKKTFEREHV